MQDLRIILIITGAIAIAALLIHGLWSSQKGRQKPIREKPMNKVNTLADDDNTFDKDGIGRVSVVASAQSGRRFNDEDEPAMSPLSSSAFDDDIEDSGPRIGPAVSSARPAAPEAGYQRRYEQGEIDPLFDEPEPAVSERRADPRPAVEPKVEAVVEDEPLPPAPEPVRRPKTWQDVYVVNLMARPNQQLQGNALLRMLTVLGFKFGEMEIFHRHKNPSGQGEVMFSLINMVKPGTFDPNAMATFTTPGVSIFMQLPEPGLGKVHFNLMIQAAETLAEELDGLLFDGERSPLSPDYLAHCREQLRDYDNQLN